MAPPDRTRLVERNNPPDSDIYYLLFKLFGGFLFDSIIGSTMVVKLSKIDQSGTRFTFLRANERACYNHICYPRRVSESVSRRSVPVVVDIGVSENKQRILS